MIITMKRFKELVENAVKLRNPVSQWEKGVLSMVDIILYTCDDDFVITSVTNLKKHCLNGADNWSQYSYGGNALIYNCDIVECFYTKSQRKRFYFDDGRCRDTDLFNNLLEVQTRALCRAWYIISDLYLSLNEKESKIICECPDVYKTILKSDNKYSFSVFYRISENVFLKIGHKKRTLGMTADYKHLKNNYGLMIM